MLDVVDVVEEGGVGLFGLEATAVHDVLNSVFTFEFVTEMTLVSVTWKVAEDPEERMSEKMKRK